MPDKFEFHQGDSPLLISFPHDGTDIPSDLLGKLTKAGKSNSDCDWHIAALYGFIDDLDISYIKPKYSRYVVDLNRSAEGELLYPGQVETGICPLNNFNGESLYLANEDPDKSEIESRVENYWRPYHQHIRNELQRIKNKHGHAILWDAHSISGEVPLLFDGHLPDLNFGSANGASCDEPLMNELIRMTQENSDYSVVLNQRFKGGYITRHYGDPKNSINAIQLEINQNNYLSQAKPLKIDEEKAKKLTSMLQLYIQLLAK
jgi:N-formylglutamate deformylase